MKKNLKIIIMAGLITLVGMVLSFSIVHSGNNPSRVESINIFNQPDTRAQITADINNDRNLDVLPPKVSPFFHNSFWSYFTLVFENYIENFRPGFLLIHGDAQPRHNPATHGEIYWASFVLIIGGIVFLYGRNNKILFLLLGWIMIVPIATAIVGPPHALRDSLMMPALLILAAFGGEKLLESKRRIRNMFLMFIIGLYLTETAFFVDAFYFVAPNKYARYWAYPAKHASMLALQNKSKYDYIILSNRIDNMEFALPAYGKLDPQRVIAQNKTGVMIGDYHFLNYDNIYIGFIPEVQIKDFISKLPGSVFYIGPAVEKGSVDAKELLNGPDLLPDLVTSEKK